RWTEGIVGVRVTWTFSLKRWRVRCRPVTESALAGTSWSGHAAPGCEWGGSGGRSTLLHRADMLANLQHFLLELLEVGLLTGNVSAPAHARLAVVEGILDLGVGGAIQFGSLG